MSHVYQPLLIRTLVRAGGSAALRQLATVLVEDESQLLYYEDRIKKMPLPVLRSHEIVTSNRDLVSLNAARLSYEERAAIELACTQKLADFLQRRGLATWDYRLLESDPGRCALPSASCCQRCALCGATSTERRIEVDHIIPRGVGCPGRGVLRTEVGHRRSACSIAGVVPAKVRSLERARVGSICCTVAARCSK